MQTNEKMHTWSWLKIKQKNKNYCQPAFFVRMNNLKIIVLCKERNSKKSFFGIHLIIIITCFRFIWLLLPFHICYLILKHKLSFIVHFSSINTIWRLEYCRKKFQVKTKHVISELKLRAKHIIQNISYVYTT